MAPPAHPTPAVITWLSDFGGDDAYVGIMKGVALGINPHVRFVDLAHNVPPQDVLRGALILRSALPYFPAGTVHVAVVDPGVGSTRQPLLIRTPTAFLVGPDNGVLHPAAAAAGEFSAYRIEDSRYFRTPVSQTFHGRDVFAPVAAHVSLDVPAHAFGPKVASIRSLDLPKAVAAADGVIGEVIYTDRFGNLITNIDSASLARFRGVSLSVSIGATAVAGPVTHYAAVEQGSLLAIVGSWSVLEVAVRNGSAAETLHAGPGTPVTVKVKDTGS
jgi:hypothetical protein